MCASSNRRTNPCATGKPMKLEPFFVEKRPDEGQKQELPAVKPPKMVRAASPSGG